MKQPNSQFTSAQQRRRTQAPPSGNTSDIGSNVSNGGGVKRPLGNSTPANDTECNVGFFMLQAVEHLKAVGKPVPTKQLQQIIRFPSGRNVLQFLYALKEHPRISFNNENKAWKYVLPFSHITDVESLLHEVNDPQYKWTGLQITPELLEGETVTGIIDEVISKRIIRAVRVGKAVRCKNFTPESSMQCFIYDKLADKCDNCANLVGIALYALDTPQVEALQNYVDEDIKELWLDVQMPTYDNFIAEQKLEATNKVPMKTLSRRKRRAMAAKGEGQNINMRFNKIINLHIYTAEEYKQELLDIGNDR